LLTMAVQNEPMGRPCSIQAFSVSSVVAGMRE